MELEFGGEVVYWRGPAPWYFITIPVRQCAEIAAISASVSYGWGVIPVRAQIGVTTWTTSLFPKDGRYLVPVKALVRKAEGIEEGEKVRCRLTIDA